MHIKNNYVPIPYYIEKLIYKHSINKLLPFAPLNSKQKSYFNKEYIKNAEYKKYHIRKNIILNIKKSHIRDEVIQNHYKIINNLNKIKQKYKNTDIIELSTKYNFPPVSLFKLILNIDQKKFIRILNGEYSDLKDRDKENFKLAVENDMYSVLDEEKQLEEATEFEKQIETILKENKVEFKTQDEMVEEQIKKYGKPINTPDFLLMKPFDNIYWIDAKNFYGANTKFNYKKIKKQTEKYINEYGNGCIIFKYGYCKEFADKFKDIRFLSFDQIN